MWKPRRFTHIALLVAEAAIFISLVALPARPGSATAGESRPGWTAEWKRTVDAANKEGQVTIYGSRGYQLIVDEGSFQKAYPGINVVTVSSEAGVFMNRLMTERRAGKYLADLVISGASNPVTLYEAKLLEPITPALLLPEVLDQSKWRKGKHYYNDPEKRYVFQYIGSPMLGGVYYNTALVKPGEFSSFWDLLNPKWKGKLVMRDVRMGGSGTANMRFLYYNPRLGPEYIRRLINDMDVTLVRDDRQAVNWLATGKFAVCFFCVSSQIGTAKKQGLPIETFGLFKEGAGIHSQSGSVGLMMNAPHPNAAKVFLNWLLSREGQLTMQKAYAKAGVGASNSFRIDIPKDMIPAHQRIQDDVEYIEVENPETSDMGPTLEVFEAALRQAEARRAQSR